LTYPGAQTIGARFCTSRIAISLKAPVVEGLEISVGVDCLWIGEAKVVLAIARIAKSRESWNCIFSSSDCDCDRKCVELMLGYIEELEEEDKS